MSTATLQQQQQNLKRTQLGIIPTKQQQPRYVTLINVGFWWLNIFSSNLAFIFQEQTASPNPLRLFPRSISINKVGTAPCADEGTTFKRGLKFVGLDDVRLEESQVVGEIITFCEEEVDEDKALLETARSPYRSATSSDNTPNSITDELTDVPGPLSI